MVTCASGLHNIAKVKRSVSDQRVTLCISKRHEHPVVATLYPPFLCVIFLQYQSKSKGVSCVYKLPIVISDFVSMVTQAKVFSKTVFSMVIPEVEDVMKQEGDRKSVVLFGIEVRGVEWGGRKIASLQSIQFQLMKNQLSL